MNRLLPLLLLAGCASPPEPVYAPPPPRPKPEASAAAAFPVDDGFEVRLGGNTFIDVVVPVEIGGWPLVKLYRLVDGLLAVDLDLHGADGDVLARVRASRLSGPEAHRFLARRSDERWTLTERATGAVLCDLRKAGNRVDVGLSLRAPNGTLWEATPEALDLRPLNFRHNVFKKCRVGIAVSAR